MELKSGNDLYKKHRFLWHILFWLSFWSYDVLVYGALEDAYRVHFISSLITLPLKIIATYFTIYILIDRYLLKNKYTQFFIYLVGSMILFGISLRVLSYFTVYKLFFPEALKAPVLYFPKIAISIFSIYSIAAIAATFHLIKHSYRNLKERQMLLETAQQLEKGKLEAELKLLKSQINPHFLFNTLNNLYVLTLNNSSKSPEVVYKLSQLMDYMLYESNQPIVSLEKEIQYIQNYISLENLRHGERLDVSLNIYEIQKEIFLPPLLLLPFIENCFKHGVNNQLSKVWVRIDILIKNGQLIMKVENSKSDSPIDIEIKKSSGLGLKNAKMRLDLLYKDKYDLQIMNEPDTFLVVLKLQLNEDTLQSFKSIKKAEVNY